MDLCERKDPPVLPPSENLNRYVEDFDEPRMKLADFFSTLLGALEAGLQKGGS